MESKDTSEQREYFRGDERSGISPPDPSQPCTYAEHVVRARGKRTPFTSISLDKNKIGDFGDTLYKYKRAPAEIDGHQTIEHEELLNELRRVIAEEEKADRLRAIQAMRYATARKEGLVQWNFDISRIARKEVITWASGQVQKYFAKV